MKVKILCGMDEAGRGPLAGPVSASAVVLPTDFPIEELKDSKKLSEKRRSILEIKIKERSCWSVVLVDHKTIDEINILNASLLAMKLAFEDMIKKLPSFCEREYGSDVELEISAIVDGTFCPEITVDCLAKPKADSSVPEVMAASILAKTERDRVMIEYAKKYPEYGYERHKGYATKEHLEILRRIGPSPIQRQSFNYK